MTEDVTEEITVEQALKKLDQISEEWVEKDLDKGIPVSFRYWRGGRYKDFLTRMLWQSILIPFVFGLVVLTCAMKKEWKVFVILLVVYIIYWIIGALLWRREKGNFIIKTDGITIVTPKDKIYIPWNVITDITSSYDESSVSVESMGEHRGKPKYGNAYELVISTQKKCYSFYEVYVGMRAKDPEGRVNPALMPLHVAYKLMKSAYKKVKKM